MKQFNGFPAKMQFTPVPNLFFSSLLPEIDNIVELKVTLHIFRAIYSKKGYLRYVTYSELLNDKNLVASLGKEEPAEEALRQVLELAAKRGTIIHLSLAREGKPENVYFLNDEAGRSAVGKIQNGEMALAGLKGAQVQPDTNTEAPPNIFALYEQNIGMLTPMIADELREVEKLYPESWISEAINISVNLNKRNWSYISAILERWATEGKGDGTYRGDSKTSPDKFSKQKYGDIIQR